MGNLPATQSKDVRLLLGLLGALLAVLVAAALYPGEIVFDVSVYLAMHTALEMFSVVVAWLVFVIGWNTHDAARAATTTLLGCAFLAVAAVDFGHALSYSGMPNFITPSSPEKAIFFSLTTRALAALAMLALAFLAWRPLPMRATRYYYLAATGVVVVFVYWIGLFQADSLPRTYVPGVGLTPLKVGIEHVLVALHTLAAIAFYVRLRRDGSATWAYLFAASGAMGLSQVLIGLYAHPYDVHNLLSHLYRLVAYFLIYRGVFLAGIREPYELANRLRDELHDSAARLRDMALRMQADIEAERKRIARSLHDEMGQDLTALRMDFGWIRKHYVDHGAITEVTERMQKTVEGTATAMRRIIGDLRPLVLDDLGIAAAAKTLTDDFATRTGLHVDFEAEGEFAGLSEAYQTALYRILQESLTNVARHAGATRVEIRLREEADRVSLSVRDDGQGFAEAARSKRGSFGLLGMSERAHQFGGALTVDSATGGGTTIAVWLPTSNAFAHAGAR
jgi:signal transduction histidine kinase